MNFGLERKRDWGICSVCSHYPKKKGNSLLIIPMIGESVRSQCLQITKQVNKSKRTCEPASLIALAVIDFALIVSLCS